jgi:hypothetical protein
MKPRCTNECAEDFKRLETEKSKLVMAAVRKGSDFRWLIEAPGARYLAVKRLTSGSFFEWTANHDKALAFRSEEQADDMMTALRHMDREHDSYQNHGNLSWGKLFGFEPMLGNAKAVEHGWLP